MLHIDGVMRRVRVVMATGAMVATLGGATVLACSQSACPPWDGSCDSSAYIPMHKEWVPNLSHEQFYTGDSSEPNRIVFRSTGDWSDSAAWRYDSDLDPSNGVGAWTNGVPGTIPVDGSHVVVISEGDVSTLDEIPGWLDAGVNEPGLFSLVVENTATLIIDPDDDLELRVRSILVKPGGTLILASFSGSEWGPIGCDRTVTITFASPVIDSTKGEADPGRYHHPKDLQQFGIGLVCMGNLYIHGCGVRPFVRLAEEPDDDQPLALSQSTDEFASTTAFPFLQAMVGVSPDRAWQAGDELLVPDTRQLHSSPKFFRHQFDDTQMYTPASAEPRLSDGTDDPAGPQSDSGMWEVVTVDDLDSITNSVSFFSPHTGSTPTVNALEYEDGHRGPKEPTSGAAALAIPASVLEGSGTILPHVANLTRNIVFRSEHPSYVRRGHVLIAGEGEVSIRFARFTGLGRTMPVARMGIGGDGINDYVAGTDPPPFPHVSTTRNFDRNQIGRYPLHIHHLQGPAPETAPWPDGALRNNSGFAHANVYGDPDEGGWFPYEWRFRMANVPDASPTSVTPPWFVDHFTDPSDETPPVVTPAFDAFQYELVGNVVDGGKIASGLQDEYAADSAGYERFLSDANLVDPFEDQGAAATVPVPYQATSGYDHFVLSTRITGAPPVEFQYPAAAPNTDPSTPADEDFAEVRSRFRLGPRWGIAVHDSHYGLIQDNIVYNVAGSGISTEDGNESYNVFNHNFVSRITRGQSHADGADGERPFKNHTGSGIWMRGPNNVVANNVVNGAVTYGVEIQAYSLAVDCTLIPKFPGASTHSSCSTTYGGSYPRSVPYSTNLEEFLDRGSEAYEDFPDPNHPYYDQVPTHAELELDPDASVVASCYPKNFEDGSAYGFYDAMSGHESGDETEAFVINTGNMNLLHWGGNEVYGCTRNAHGLYTIGQHANIHYWVEASRIDGNVVWNCPVGFKSYRADFLDFNDNFVYGDINAMYVIDDGFTSRPIGFQFHERYSTRANRINGGCVWGMAFGIAAPPNNLPPDTIVGREYHTGTGGIGTDGNAWNPLTGSGTRDPRAWWWWPVVYDGALAVSPTERQYLDLVLRAVNGTTTTASEGFYACDDPGDVPPGTFSVNDTTFWNVYANIAVPQHRGQFAPNRRLIELTDCKLQLVDASITQYALFAFDIEGQMPRYNLWMLRSDPSLGSGVEYHGEQYDDAFVVRDCLITPRSDASNAAFSNAELFGDTTDEDEGPVSVHYLSQVPGYPLTSTGNASNWSWDDNPDAYAFALAKDDNGFVRQVDPGVGPFFRQIGGETLGEEHPRTRHDLGIHGLLRPWDGSESTDPDTAPAWKTDWREDRPLVSFEATVGGYLSNSLYLARGNDAIRVKPLLDHSGDVTIEWTWWTSHEIDGDIGIEHRLPTPATTTWVPATADSNFPHRWTASFSFDPTTSSNRTVYLYITHDDSVSNYACPVPMASGRCLIYPDLRNWIAGWPWHVAVQIPDLSAITASSGPLDTYFDGDCPVALLNLQTDCTETAALSSVTPIAGSSWADTEYGHSVSWAPSEAVRNTAFTVFRSARHLDVNWTTPVTATSTVGIRESVDSGPENPWSEVQHELWLSRSHRCRVVTYDDGVSEVAIDPHKAYDIRVVSIGINGAYYAATALDVEGIDATGYDPDDYFCEGFGPGEHFDIWGPSAIPDGAVDVYDTTALSDCFDDSPPCNPAWDFNGDGDIDGLDLQAMQDYILANP